MRIFIISLVLVFLAVFARAQTDLTPLERVQFWTSCEPIKLDFSFLNVDAALHTTEQELETILQDRLRAANLKADLSSVILAVNITYIGLNFTIEFTLLNTENVAPPIWTFSLNSIGDDYPFVHILTGIIDEFIADYLRVNAASC